MPSEFDDIPRPVLNYPGIRVWQNPANNYATEIHRRDENGNITIEVVKGEDYWFVTGEDDGLTLNPSEPPTEKSSC